LGNQSRAAKVIIALILIVALISGTSLFEVNALSHLNIAGTGTPTPAPTTQPTTPPTVQPTTPPTVQPTSSPQNPVWNVILNRAASSLTYNNFTVTDTVGHHFLVITLSFANNTPQTQPINGNLLDLQDSAGDHYQEDQASNPQKTFNVLSGQSIELTIAYVVPDTQCQYTLVFNDPTGQPMSWNIQIDRAFCTA
jgi:hypothetical protein